MEKCRRYFARLYICVYIYININIKFAKLHSVGYHMSTSTSQEKAHSLENMQKCENKAVCVKTGIGVAAVPEQVVLPRPALGHMDGQPAPWGQSPLPLSHQPARRDTSALWEAPDLTSCCPCRLWLTGTCVCFLLIFQHQVCSSGCPKSQLLL